MRHECRQPGSTPPFFVRSLRPADAEAIIAIDAASIGRWLRLKLERAFAATGMAMSLVAEVNGFVVGFVLAHATTGNWAC